MKRKATKQKAEEQKKPRTAIKPLNWIMRAIPALGPVPAMWSVYAAATDKLHWPVPVAGAAALAVEGLGFASVNLAERMYTHNKSLRLDERAQKLEAPTGKAILATGFYLVVVIAMIILVDVAPTATIFLPLAFPFLGITGAAVWAMGSEQDERERVVQEWRAKKEASKSSKKAQVAGASDKQPVQETDKLHASKTRKGDKLQVQGVQVAGARADKLQGVAGKDDKQVSKQPVQDEALLAIWGDKPKASDRQVAEQFGTSRQAIQQRREKLIKQGSIRMGKGGVEIIGIEVTMQAEAK
jgi:hypothetical protein